MISERDRQRIINFLLKTNEKYNSLKPTQRAEFVKALLEHFKYCLSTFGKLSLISLFDPFKAARIANRKFCEEWNIDGVWNV